MSSGGIEFVSGGTAIGTVVTNGGQETVQYGGTAIGTVVSSGGTLDCLARRHDRQHADNGYVDVSFGGIASDTTVNGVVGEQVVELLWHRDRHRRQRRQDGRWGRRVSFRQWHLDRRHRNERRRSSHLEAGVASGTVVNPGGTQVVYASGITSDTVVNSGGTQVVYGYIYGAGTAIGTVVNSGGA